MLVVSLSLIRSTSMPNPGAPASGGRAGAAPGRLWHSEGVRASILVALAVTAVIVSSCSPPPPPDYQSTIAALRADKDVMFGTAPESPLLPDTRDQFLPLTYFPIDESYAVPAQLSEATQRTVIEMPTSTGLLRQMERVGTLQFTLKGEPMQLAAFVDAGTERITTLFVPFTDLTSGAETYPAGRYMDLEPMATGIYIVDFNVAYHPYCYYNAEYDCPYPPSENRIQMPIRAGERLPKAESSIP